MSDKDKWKEEFTKVACHFVEVRDGEAVRYYSCHKAKIKESGAVVLNNVAESDQDGNLRGICPWDRVVILSGEVRVFWG